MREGVCFVVESVCCCVFSINRVIVFVCVHSRRRERVREREKERERERGGGKCTFSNFQAIDQDA